eukprot:TRINITY_DN3174_c0_g1_i1.p2 TRINITY_DN3174_c0_g1~~TRINITY_DN3174_c0_g1_i1.p2  ORF type:complete len:157 (-),score=28.70 TRINITY_DN3174_c0_g1_i1:213-683(-)
MKILLAIVVLASVMHTATAITVSLRGSTNTTKAPQCTCCGGQNCQILRCGQSGSNVDAAMSFRLAKDFTCSGKQLREVIVGAIRVTNWLEGTGNNNLGFRRVDECTSAGTILPSGSTITVQVAPTTNLGSGTGTYTLFDIAEDTSSAVMGCGEGAF